MTAAVTSQDMGRVQHADLVEYLRRSRWRAKGRGRAGAARFEHEGNERSSGQPVLVEIVTEPELADYRRRNEEVVRLLADFEGVSLNDMIEAIASPSADVRVRFSAGEFEILPALAKRLRDREESIQHTVTGYIVSLKQAHVVVAETGGPGEVVVVTPREDQPRAELRVRISLNAAEYKKALQAHRDAQKIQVVGTLKKKQRRWHLDDPSPISVLPTRDEDDEP
jgi:hypothetical protein